ncbi:CusA/CzcA family heavy metal efflux RND transporter [Maribacter sp. PR1]|uniref:CusA/CzcA family heavy metal efflux RND transporter n=1 Tax=Maribacter cobaltidurans TaxID=1178778 RepID=A0ABU7IWT8_9FLAO|nr:MULTISPECIES: CusA/CzcA family heavy metal efflux RND transporter [Maribacter]MDC6389669.1 CusA/CzcA family heavy metal efflux RND transporter [Maribacter sp. PR1]MEE1977058.1 CusA/CzcA family heavy metal efflux RND transporter [Maribacter cobaltidurans]
MLSRIIDFSIKNKFIVLLFTCFIIGFGVYSLTKIPIGAVPDVTNNQVQVITTSRNLSTQDIEQFITYPVELEMANLPGVVEIRSVSKFGLSVVTIVFEDDMGTYLPRQLIAEKIKSAAEKIPDNFGTPEMGPITTGLGEIYQYILDVKPEYKEQYTAQDLRTIQDWIVKRQLSGIPGVVEVNTWGGFLKQYEVAISTEKLNAMNISAQDVFKAIESNNSVAGGGYIEKVNQAFFIRGEGLVNSLKDIENIVVKNDNGIPIYIKDVAHVGFGNATRFGAITGNGEGEKVLGQVMMLKDANSKKVIEAVKERVANISKSLPEGVYINAFLDRSELIAKTTFTVTENLILGCLIVIFVVVLLLGNLRSGLVVASVIPLCLLFALSLMYIFGVDANLMSLGAIDFGIIIDGAVIIVEFIAFNITKKHTELERLNSIEQQKLRDDITYTGATKMMNSAIFGQLIILIVFIPILSLSGVEGKMFKPMALTFSFALIGAMLLCFTYVPVVSSIFLKPSKTTDKNVSVRLMKWLTDKYDPIIDWALRSKKVVLGVAALLLAIAVSLYMSMGGEFVPTLDEGDFVIQPVLKTGTSLSKTVEITTEIENILLKQFPEVNQVVTRIGAAEVPTDPMSMEESDVIIVLNPKSEWTSASSKDELADKFKEALSVIPGMEVEFTQPIEMRFNELITGVRADIAIKVFGENLDILAKKGKEIGELIQNVPGAADISVEKIAGLPEMNVKYNRSKIARYGLNIQELNDMISMGFAGKTAGSVFEGEKKFDLVIRLDDRKRKDIENLRNLYVDIPSEGKIPLSELAEITYQKGAAKISRDDTRRRIVVGINVRNRDLQSVVDDVRKLIDENVKLPVGYSITYGGQFENLQSAKSRLLFAVPIALILIFILLYFAFKSVKEALMIYSAIPLAAVGGVLLLWIRDLPFSISAGVGFIALFGIAVLNGIVLIEHFKELKSKEIFNDMNTLIKEGAKDRLRAVLLTASAAALGFLPMAISTNAGAEVQRPLATVVIGGLITATILTLVVLPVLYSYLNSHIENEKNRIKSPLGVTVILVLFTMVDSMAQDTSKNLQELIPMAIENNKELKSYKLRVEQSDALVNSAFNLEKTDVYYHFDENNLAMNNEPLRVFGVSQNFSFPTVYFSQRKVNKAQLNISQSTYEIKKKELERMVTTRYFEYQLAREKTKVFQILDSLYNNFSSMANRRFELGETNYLEKITATSKQKQIQLKYEEARRDVQISYENLLKTVQSEDRFEIIEETILKLPRVDAAIESSPEISFFQNQIGLKQAEKSLENQQLLPDIGLNYFQGTNDGLNDNLHGYQLGLKIPLFFGGQASRIKSAKIAEQSAEAAYNNYEIQLSTKLKTLTTQLEVLDQSLEYYENEGSLLSDEILKTANSSFKNGEIDFYQYIQSLESSYDIKLEYLNKLEAYNNTVIAINYITL